MTHHATRKRELGKVHPDTPPVPGTMAPTHNLQSPALGCEKGNLNVS